MSEKTTVVNVRDRVPGAIYVGRANGRWHLKQSQFANPYRIGPDGSREEVIEKYRAWLLANPYLMSEIGTLRGKVLSCWCKEPGKDVPCHADVLAEFANREQEVSSGR